MGSNQTTDPTAFSGLGPRFRAYCESYSAEPCIVEVAGIDLIINPRVFRAAGASTTATLIEALGTPDGLRVLDMGCGTGIVGILAALRGASSVVLADKSSEAVHNAQMNVEFHGLEACCEVRQSDLFSSIDDGPFDLIVFNVPFLYAQEETSEILVPVPLHLEQAIPPPDAFIDVGYRLIREFMRDARAYLTATGVIRCTFASFANHAAFDEILGEFDLVKQTLVSRPEPEYGLEYLAYEIRPERPVATGPGIHRGRGRATPDPRAQ